MKQEQPTASLSASFKQLLNTRSYRLPLLFSLLATYTYFLCNYSVGIDDLAGYRYYYGELFAQGRFSATFFHHLFGFVENAPFVSDLFGLLLLAFSAVVFCALFDRSVKTCSVFAKTVFSCLLVTAPIYAELFSYNGTCLAVGFGFLAVALSLYLTSASFAEKKYLRLLIPASLLAVCASWYESLLVVFVQAVFALLILDVLTSEEKTRFKTVLFKGLFFAAPLILGVLLELAFQVVFLAVFPTPESVVSTNGIKWFSGETNLLYVFKTIVVDGILAALWNRTVGIFVLALCLSCVLCVLCCVKKKSALPALLFFCLIVTNFALPLISGSALGYRMCQSFGFFTAFCVWLLFFLLEQSTLSAKDLLRRTLSVLAVYLVIFQISVSNYWYFWDYQKYLGEADTVKQIAATLTQDYDITKPVVFVGTYTPSDVILEHTHLSEDDACVPLVSKLDSALGLKILQKDTRYVKQIPQTITTSCINWGMDAFGEGNTELFEFLRFHGIDCFKQGSAEQLEEARALADTLPRWPQNGSIRDMGDYIVVNF